MCPVSCMTYFLVWSPLVTTCVMCAVRQEKSPARYKSLSVYLSPVTCASPEWWKIFQLHCLKPATDGFTKLVRLTLVWAPDTCVECCHPGSDTRWLETGDTGQEDRGLREEKAATVTQIMKRDKNKTSSPASLKWHHLGSAICLY